MRKPLFSFLLLLLSSVAAHLALLLFWALDLPEFFTVWRIICLPLAALALPACFAYRGVPPVCAWFPQGLCYLILPPTSRLTALWGLSLLLFGVSVLGACAGHEMAKRSEKRKGKRI